MNERTMPAALRWASRWRAAARIARRDAARHRGRTMLVAGLVALPLVAGSAGLVLIRSTEPTDASIVRDALGSTVQARITAQCDGVTYVPTSQGSGGSCAYGTDPAPVSTDGMDAALAAALPAGSTVIPLRIGLVDYRAGEQSQQSRSYAEIDLSEGLGTLGALDEGRAPRDPSEILVSGHMARSGPIDIGDTIALRPDTHGEAVSSVPVDLTVVGISRVGAGISADFVGLPGSPLDPFGEGAEPSVWYVVSDSPVLLDHAERLYPLGLDALSRDVVPTDSAYAQVPGSMVHLSQRVSSYSTNVAVIATVVLLILLEAILLIGPAFVVGARRETRNLALVAATGGQPADLRRIVLATGLVVGGTMIGAVLGVALLPALRTQDIYVSGAALPVAKLCALALGGTAIALAAAWLPARQAARTDVVAALSGRRPVTLERRRTPVVGLACLGLGTTAAFTGALTGWTVVLVLGILAVELGVIGTAGAVVAYLSRTAHRTGPMIRYALRDAERHRARTAPALAAIIAATAVAGAAVSFQASSDASSRRLDIQPAAVGTLIVGMSTSSAALTADDGPPLSLHEGVEVYDEFLVGALGKVPITEVQAAVPSRASQGETIERLRPHDEGCPTVRGTQDPRCSAFAWGSTPLDLSGQNDPVLVDDGTAIRALGLPDSDTIAAALATEHAVVASERDLWTDAHGSTFAHLAVPGLDEPVVVPAVAHRWGEVNYRLVLPPSIVSEIGWATVPVGLVVPEMGNITAAQRTALQNLPRVPGIYAMAEIQKEWFRPPNKPLVAIVVGAVLLSILATWIVVGLAASESRPDLATISAVGASPRSRRRLAGAQAGVLAVVGTGLGLVTGVFFGGMLVLTEHGNAGGAGWAWRLDIPWMLLALIACTAPVLAISGAVLTTRSRLPLVRRLAS